MKLLAKGKAWIFPERVDTDMLAPTPYLHLPIEDSSKHCMEASIPEFAQKVREGDVVLAGAHFGKGSSREHAALALKHLGVKAVIAVSIAPIMKRNLFNLGVPAFEDPDIPLACGEGDKVEVTTEEFRDLTRGFESPLRPLPLFMTALVERGGLFDLIMERGGLSKWSRPLEDRLEVLEVGNTKIFPASDKYVDTVVERLERGEVLCGPFDTTYGLFASIRRPDAVKKVYELKRRKEDMPLTLIVPRERFHLYAEVPEKVQRMLDSELKGPISIILPKKGDRVPDYVTSGLKTVSLADGENAFMKRVMERIEICGTSANISGSPPPNNLAGALKQLGEGLTLAVNGGPTLYRIGHTVIDLSIHPPKLIRAGPYKTDKLKELFPDLNEEEEGVPDELLKGRSVIEISPEVRIKAGSRKE